MYSLIKKLVPPKLLFYMNLLVPFIFRILTQNTNAINNFDKSESFITDRLAKSAKSSSLLISYTLTHWTNKATRNLITLLTIFCVSPDSLLNIKLTFFRECSGKFIVPWLIFIILKFLSFDLKFIIKLSSEFFTRKSFLDLVTLLVHYWN